MSRHSDLGLGNNHGLPNWSYADEAERLAAIDFIEADVGKVAVQQDNLSYWLLSAITPTWTALAGAGAGGGDFSTVSTNAVPVNSGSQVFVNSGVHVDIPTLAWTFDTAITVPAGSINVGETMSLSEGGSDLIIGNLISGVMSFSVNSDFSDITGSSVPSYNDFGAAFVLNINTDFSNTITNNPLTFPIIASVLAPDSRLVDRFTIKTGSALTNFRVKMTDNASGLVIRYIPSKAAYDGDLAGFDLAAGDNTFFFSDVGVDTANQFYLGYVPFVLQPGQTINVEVIADAIDILGSILDVPYLVAEAHDGPLIELKTVKSDTFLELTDTPVDYVGDALTTSRVNATADGLEFVDVFSGVDGEVGKLDLATNTLISAGATVDALNIWTLANKLRIKTPVLDGTVGLFIDDSASVEQLSIVYDDLTGLVTITPPIGAGVPGIELAGNLRPDVSGSRSVGSPTKRFSHMYLASIVNYNTELQFESDDGIFLEFNTNPNDANVELTTPTLLGKSQVRFRDSTSGVRGNIAFNGNDDRFDFETEDQLRISTSNANAIILRQQDGTNQNPLLNLTNAGTDGASVFVYMSDVRPDNIITGNPGDLCIFESLDSSALFVHKGTVSDNTSWNEFLVGPPGFEPVTGPTVSTDLTIPTWDGTSGDILQDNPLFLYTVSGENRTLQITSGGTAGTAALHLADSISPSVASFSYDEATGSVLLSSNSGDLTLESEVGDIDALVTNSTGVFEISGLTHSDDAAILKLTVGVVSSEFHVGAQDPEGNVSTGDGAIYFRTADAASNIFRHQSVGFDSADWFPMVGGPNTGTTVTSIPSWSTVNGDTLIDNPNVLINTSISTETDLIIKAPTAAGSGRLIFRDSSNFGHFTLEYSDADDLVSMISTESVEMSFINTTNSFLVVGGHTDATPLFQLEATGLNGAAISYLVGDRNPFNNVTGNPGDVYFSSNGTNSGLYQHKGASANNTDWSQALSVGEAINAVSSSVALDILVWSGTSGDTVFDTVGLQAITDSGNRGINITTPGTTGNPQLNLKTSIGGTALTIFRVSDTSGSTIRNSIGTFDITNTSDEIFTIGATGTGRIDIAPTIGQQLRLTDNIRITNDGTDIDIRVRSASSGSSIFCLENSAGAAALEAKYDDDLDNTTITNAFGALSILSNEALGHININTTGTQSNVDITADDGDVFLTAQGSGITGNVLIQGDEGVALLSSSLPVQLTAGTAVTDAAMEVSNIAGSILSRTYLSDDDPNGVITGSGGDLAIRDQAALSSMYFNKAATTDDVWFHVSMNPPTIHEIFSAGDLDALATATVITITVDTVFIFKATVVTDVTFNVTGGSLVLRNESDNFFYIYTGTGTLITSTVSVYLERWAAIFASTGTYFDLVGVFNNALVINNCFLGNGTLGTVGRLSTSQAGLVVQISLTVFNNPVGSLICTDNASLKLSNVKVNRAVATGEALIQFSNPSNLAPDISISHGSGQSQSTDSLIRIDAGFQGASTANIVANNFDLSAGAEYFDTSGIAPTAYTIVADASIAPTAITTVSDNSGVAVFNHTGTTPPLGSTVVISGFANPANLQYNTTGRVTASTATTFELEYVAFGITETGSYLVDAVTVTSTSHGLSNETGITLDTDTATDYDGHYIVYAVTTSTFEVAKAFTVTKTGTWSTEGLNQEDPFVRAFTNASIEESHYIGTAYVNLNAVATTGIQDNTFKDMVFGTAGVALIPGTTMERWKLVDEIIGTFEYTGNERFDGYVTFDISSSSSGSTLDFRYKIMITGEATITATTISFADTDPDTILDSANGFLTAGFKDEDKIEVSGSAGNSSTWKIDTVAAGVITLRPLEALVAEAAGPSVTIVTNFTNLPDPVEAISAIPGTERAVTKTIPLRITKGQQIKPQVTRNSGGANITNSYATFYITQ